MGDRTDYDGYGYDYNRHENLRILTCRISQTNRIPPHIPKRIQPPIQPNRVALRVPARLRVIGAVVIIEQPGLAVIILPREAQVVGEVGRRAGGVGIRGVVAEGVGAVPLPTHHAAGVDDLPGGVQVVAEDVEQGLGAVGDGDGLVAQPYMLLLERTSLVILADQMPGLVIQVDAARGGGDVGLADALPQSVDAVAVGEGLRFGLGRGVNHRKRDKAVAAIVAVGIDGCRAGGVTADQVAGQVVFVAVVGHKVAGATYIIGGGRCGSGVGRRYVSVGMGAVAVGVVVVMHLADARDDSVG